MSIKYIEVPHISSLIDKGIVVVGSEVISHKFNKYISQHYPWTSSSINWNKINNTIQADAATFDENELTQFFDSTILNKYQQICVIYSAKQPCLIIKYANVIKYFDNLIVVTPQCYFVGAIEEEEQILDVVYDDFVEFKQSEALYISGKSK